jgi:hypothetical protein
VRFFGPNFVSFSPVVTLHFEENLSEGNRENDTISFLNVPAMVKLQQNYFWVLDK